MMLKKLFPDLELKMPEEIIIEDLTT